jgi:hypothetical protein
MDPENSEESILCVEPVTKNTHINSWVTQTNQQFLIDFFFIIYCQSNIDSR